MDREFQYIVYENCYNFLKHRGITVQSSTGVSTGAGHDKPLEKSRFIEILVRHTYITIKGRDEKNKKNISLILFSPDNKYLQGKVAIKKFMDKNVNDGDILITETTQSHHNIKSIARESNIYVFTGCYEFLMFNFPTHRCYIDYKIMPEENVKKFTQYEHRKLSHLPRCYTSDCAIFWSGAKPNDIVYCIRPSDTAGEAFYMRRVYDVHYMATTPVASNSSTATATSNGSTTA